MALRRVGQRVKRPRADAKVAHQRFDLGIDDQLSPPPVFAKSKQRSAAGPHGEKRSSGTLSGVRQGEGTPSCTCHCEHFRPRARARPSFSKIPAATRRRARRIRFRGFQAQISGASLRCEYNTPCRRASITRLSQNAFPLCFFYRKSRIFNAKTIVNGVCFC